MAETRNKQTLNHHSLGNNKAKITNIQKQLNKARNVYKAQDGCTQLIPTTATVIVIATLLGFEIIPSFDKQLTIDQIIISFVLY